MNREQRRKAKKRKEQNVPQPVVHYVCDPEKNTACKRPTVTLTAVLASTPSIWSSLSSR